MDESAISFRVLDFHREIMRYGAARPGEVLLHLAERIIRLEERVRELEDAKPGR